MLITLGRPFARRGDVLAYLGEGFPLPLDAPGQAAVAATLCPDESCDLSPIEPDPLADYVVERRLTKRPDLLAMALPTRADVVADPAAAAARAWRLLTALHGGGVPPRPAPPAAAPAWRRLCEVAAGNQADSTEKKRECVLTHVSFLLALASGGLVVSVRRRRQGKARRSARVCPEMSSGAGCRGVTPGARAPGWQAARGRLHLRRGGARLGAVTPVSRGGGGVAVCRVAADGGRVGRRYRRGAGRGAVRRTERTGDDRQHDHQ